MSRVVGTKGAKQKAKPVVVRRQSGPPASSASDGGVIVSAPIKPEIKDLRPKIEVAIERGNRMMIRWPRNLAALTSQLSYNESSISDSLLGSIEELKDGINKKLTPLNFLNAYQVLHFISLYEAILDTRSEPIYNVDIQEDFITWFREENKAKALADEAYTVIDYDDPATVWKRYKDATPHSFISAKGDTVHQVKFPWLKIPLYVWQATGMEFMNIATRQGRGCFECDETGLGKTITILAHLKWLQEQAKENGTHFGGAVIVVPSSLIEGWVRKTKMTTDFTVCAVDTNYPVNGHKADIIIVSYNMLGKHGCWPLAEWVDKQQRVLVADESHLAKNYDSKRTGLWLMLSVYAKHSIVLTATPLKNRVLELHPQLRGTRRLWTEMSLKDFVKTYDNPDDPGSRGEVAEHLKGIMVRRRMNDVWINPPKGELGAAWLKLSNRKDYNEAEQDFIQWLSRQAGMNEDRLAAAERGHAIVKMNKLREMAANGKVAEGIKIIDTTLNHDEQAVVFCAYNDPLKAVCSHFRSKSGRNFQGTKWHGAELLIGTTPKHKRTEMIDRFNAGKIGLLCIGVGAGGMGIDLPIARFGYFLDLPWTPADFEQCTGRLLRLGQERDCQFVKLLAEHTIDQRMEAIIQFKAGIFAEAIGDEEALERVTAKDTMEQDTIVSALIASYMRDPEGVFLPH